MRMPDISAVTSPRHTAFPRSSRVQNVRRAQPVSTTTPTTVKTSWSCDKTVVNSKSVASPAATLSTDTATLVDRVRNAFSDRLHSTFRTQLLPCKPGKLRPSRHQQKLFHHRENGAARLDILQRAKTNAEFVVLGELRARAGIESIGCRRPLIRRESA